MSEVREDPGIALQEPKERGDLADPKKVGRKELLDRISQRQEQDDVRLILSTKEGRRFYWKLMKKCGIFETSFTGNNTTFFNEGMRNIGLMLLKDVNEISPESYTIMLEEARHNEAQKA